MQIVINIDDEDYNNITLTGGNTINIGVLLDLREAVRKGKPLPKAHGRLIDADYKVSSDGRTVNSVCGYMAPTIIEADRSEEE